MQPKTLQSRPTPNLIGPNLLWFHLLDLEGDRSHARHMIHNTLKRETGLLKVHATPGQRIMGLYVSKWLIAIAVP